MSLSKKGFEPERYVYLEMMWFSQKNPIKFHIQFRMTLFIRPSALVFSIHLIYKSEYLIQDAFGFVEYTLPTHIEKIQSSPDKKVWKYKWFRFSPVSLAFITFKIIYYQLNNEYCNKFPTARFRLVLSFRRSLVCNLFVFSTLFLLPFVVLWILQRKLSFSSLGLFRHLLQSFERECGIVSNKK